MKVDLINGFLGAGKTTFLINLLETKNPSEKVAVLVNEFGTVGIDGDLLTGHDANVVELPNGCICCTLKADLRNQIREIAEKFKPDRLYIEPTGAATIKNLLGILESLSLEKYIENIRVILVLDAGTFMENMEKNRGFVETQLESAQIILVNKCDKVSPEQLGLIREIIRKTNCSGQVLLTSFGQVLHRDLSEPAVLPETALNNVLSGNIGATGKHLHDLPLKEYEQFSVQSSNLFDVDRLRKFFGRLSDNWYGSVDRAKGIFRVADSQWVRFDLVSREVSESFLEKEYTFSKLIVIGTDLSKKLLNTEFMNCQKG
ncbi:CobW family GTP-binding protein [Thermincola potens]|nr:GTP-binding protein [Thermincola potens]